MVLFKFNFGNLIKKLDLYGSTINLTIKHKRTSKTIIGGFVTILSLIFFVIYGIINSKNLINRLNPVVTRFGLYDKKYIKIEDSLSKIPIAISFNGLDINQYFTVYVSYKEYIKETNQYLNNTAIIPLVNCSKDHFPNVTKEIYKKEILNNSFCLNMSSLKNKSLFYSEGIEGTIEIYLTYCSVFNDEYCIPKEQLINYFSFSQGEFTVSIGVGGINPLNYKEPIQYFIEKKSIKPSPHFIQGLDIYLYEEELETDDGLFMKSQKKSFAYNILEFQSFFMSDSYDTTLGLIKIYPSNYSYYNKRVYTKIQDYLSQLGGMIGLAFNILPYFVYLFSIGLRDETILNTLLEVKNDKISYDSLKNTYTFKNLRNKISPNVKVNENEKKKMFEESSSQINIKVKTNNLVNEIKNPINNNNKDVDLFLENWEKRKINKIKFSNFEILKLYLCNCKCVINHTKSQKILLYYKYKKMVQNYLEVPFIINKIEENDKLKYILFNKKQLSLFKFISNDIVYSDNFTLKNINYLKKSFFIIMIEKLLLIYYYFYKKIKKILKIYMKKD